MKSLKEIGQLWQQESELAENQYREKEIDYNRFVEILGKLRKKYSTDFETAYSHERPGKLEEFESMSKDYFASFHRVNKKTTTTKRK